MRGKISVGKMNVSQGFQPLARDLRHIAPCYALRKLLTQFELSPVRTRREKRVARCLAKARAAVRRIFS